MQSKRNGGRAVAVMMAGLVLTGCAPRTEWGRQQADEARMQRRVAAAVRREPRLAGCGEMARLDFSALNARLAAMTRPSADAIVETQTGDHLRIRGPLGGFAPPGDAQVVLSLAAGATGHQQVRTETSSFVWKDADGTWRVDRVDDVVGGPPPPPRAPGEPPMTEDEQARARRVVLAGELDAGQTAELEQALDDVCLGLQPDYLPLDPPLLNGEDDFCYGGVGGTVVIRRDGQTRAVSDDCARYVGGRVIKLVMYARPAGVSAS